MGKTLMLRSPRDVIPSIPEFEKVDDQGKKVYCKMVVEHYTYIPGEFDHYLAVIIRRSKQKKAICSFDAILDVYHKNPLLDHLEELYSSEFIEKIKEEKKYMFDKDEVIPVSVNNDAVYEAVGVKLYLR